MCIMTVNTNVSFTSIQLQVPRCCKEAEKLMSRPYCTARKREKHITFKL